MYSRQYLGAQRCCNINVQGPQGPIGPPGIGFIGPMGATGPTGASLTGPTGRGCFGPTGPLGPISGPIGPTGPSASMPVNTNIQTASYNPTNATITLPPAVSVISYYQADVTGGNVTILNPSNLPAGYQATVIVGTTSTTVTSTVSLTNANNVQLNSFNIQLLAENTDYSQYALMSLLSDGTYCYASMIVVNNQPITN